MVAQNQVFVKFIFCGHLSQHINSDYLESKVPNNLNKAIKVICDDYPELNEPLRTGSFLILKNQSNLIGQDLCQISLSDGDTITFVPFVAGG